MSLSIYGHIVSRDRPPFVIAELGLNHSGDVDRALRLADAAADAGAGGVKVQAFRAERLVAPGCPAPTHVDAESLQGFFKGYELDMEAHARITERAHSRGLAMVATPFDEDVVGELERIGCDAYKIASGDLTYHALIERAAATGKPLLISTGMANIDEIRLALDRARHAGSSDVAILHCVSAYPVPAGQENLSAIAELRRLYGIEVGLSDHSTEDLSLPLSIALGATLYERHIALDDGPRSLNAPCHPHQMSCGNSFGPPTERGRRSAADASTRDSLKARISWPAGGASTPRASCARASASNRRALSRCVRGMALNHADSST